MAEIIPTLNRQTLARMTAGEKRVARRLEALLEDDYLVWYDIPVGRNRRYPDFIILHPSRGLLFLEVKDWKPETLRRINKSDVTLLAHNGLVTRPHPLEQVRQYAYNVIAMLSRDPHLREAAGPYRGNLIVPYGWGVVFTNISRKQMAKAIPDDSREWLLPDHLMIYKNEITDSADAEAFQEQLWGMFNYHFGGTLTLPQIDRIRWHLFPEVRIDEGGQVDLFGGPEEGVPAAGQALPDIVRIMDIQQEQLARSLGEGHRVIHGVAGSGKTLILGYRCLYLAQAVSKPILVLCFNITLAAKLRAFISSKGIGGQVQVYHFHDWCGEQLRTYHVDVKPSERPYWERQVEAVIEAVDGGHIPRAQYGALLIDEGHDFEDEWLRLVVQMVDPETNALLLLYDDAQSIYGKKGRRTLAPLGIQARGRTTILRLNYRNTAEILDFAYRFARRYLAADDADDDHVPLIEPQSAGRHGPQPAMKVLASFRQEARYVARMFRRINDRQAVPWLDMGVTYRRNWMGDELHAAFKAESVPCQLLGSARARKHYAPAEDSVKLMTMHSCKGLEFPVVAVCGVGYMSADDGDRVAEAKLLYVAMTRSTERLLVTSHTKTAFIRQLAEDAIVSPAGPFDRAAKDLAEARGAGSTPEAGGGIPGTGGSPGGGSAE